MSAQILRRRWLRAAAAAAVAVLAAACSGDPQTAAPVILKGPALEGVASAPPPPTTPKPPPRRIVVRPGQSLGGIARDYRVPQRAIIAANQLEPPYKIEIGQRLVIPGGAEPPVRRAVAAAKPPAAQKTAAAEPSERQATAAKQPQTAAREPAAKQPQTAAGPDRTKHEVIPLDDPAPPPKSTASPAITFLPAAKPGSAKPPPEAPAVEEPRVAAAASEPAQPRGRHLPWPVRGRILAAYGAGQGGGQNDGINIAAPRGAAIRAVDSGIVAYAGNEIRGYGNLVLVKHPSGFISAYAHCDELLVKRGDKVGRAQVIAKVGATGGVSEPQLHFELRRGKRAVDPREFLAPTPTAGAGEGGQEG